MDGALRIHFHTVRLSPMLPYTMRMTGVLMELLITLILTSSTLLETNTCTLLATIKKRCSSMEMIQKLTGTQLDGLKRSSLIGLMTETSELQLGETTLSSRWAWDVPVTTLME